MKLQPAEKEQRNTTVTIHCIHSKPWSQVEKLQTQTTMFVQTMKANDTTVTIHCMHSKPWSQVENLQTQTTMFVHTMQTNVIMLMGVDYTEIMM